MDRSLPAFSTQELPNKYVNVFWVGHDDVYEFVTGLVVSPQEACRILNKVADDGLEGSYGLTDQMEKYGYADLDFEDIIELRDNEGVYAKEYLRNLEPVQLSEHCHLFTNGLRYKETFGRAPVIPGYESFNMSQDLVPHLFVNMKSVPLNQRQDNAQKHNELLQVLADFNLPNSDSNREISQYVIINTRD